MSVGAYPTTAGNGEVGRLRTLYRLLASLSEATALTDVYDAALKSLLDATAADRASILIFDDDGVIRFKAARGISEEYQAAVTGHSPWPKGTRNAKPLVVPDIRADESLQPYQEIIEREGIRAMAFIPVTLENGVLGKFMLYYASPHECTGDELEMAQAIAAHVALATERRRADLARMQSERRLQAILDNSAAVIFLKDAQGRYLLVNRRYEELFHVTPDGILGRTDHEIFAPEVADRFLANDRAVLLSGEPLAVEESAPHDDGIHTYISLKFPLQEPDGTVTGVCGIATDITERKQLENASRHLAAIVESSDDAIISKNLQGIITSWNTGAERIFGYSAAEAIGNPVAILAAPERSDEMPGILSRIRKGQRVDHYETRRRRKDGEIIDVALTVSPVRDSSGQVVGASKIARDITDRKRQEKERALLLSREQEARRTAELLNQVGPRLIAQLDPEKLAQEVTDIATTLVAADFGAFFRNVVNEKGESYVLYTLSGVSRELFSTISLPRQTDLFGPAFRGETVVRREDLITNDLPDRDITEGHLPVSSYLTAPVVARSGEVLGSLFFGHHLPGQFSETQEAIVTGIAAQAAIAMDNARLFEQTQSTQAELKRSNEDLRRANRDLEVFAYSASHDLQEPLRTIAISAQLLERRLGHDLHGQDSTFLANIVTGAKRMSSLVQDLLLYTRATKYEDGPAPSVDAGHVLASVIEGLHARIDEVSATVTADRLPIVAMHESRLAQIFQNLISNALKYRSKDAPCVHVSGDDRDGWCFFSVTDNGIGIDRQYAEQIFGLFKRLHGKDEYPGSGIGLAICQRVVEQYGGRIWLERSAPGQGSTFCFVIPARV